MNRVVDLLASILSEGEGWYGWKITQPMYPLRRLTKVKATRAIMIQRLNPLNYPEKPAPQSKKGSEDEDAKPRKTFMQLLVQILVDYPTDTQALEFVFSMLIDLYTDTPEFLATVHRELIDHLGINHIAWEKIIGFKLLQSMLEADYIQPQIRNMRSKDAPMRLGPTAAGPGRRTARKSMTNIFALDDQPKIMRSFADMARFRTGSIDKSLKAREVQSDGDMQINPISLHLSYLTLWFDLNDLAAAAGRQNDSISSIDQDRSSRLSANLKGGHDPSFVTFSRFSRASGLFSPRSSRNSRMSFSKLFRPRSLTNVQKRFQGRKNVRVNKRATILDPVVPLNENSPLDGANGANHPILKQISASFPGDEVRHSFGTVFRCLLLERPSEWAMKMYCENKARASDSSGRMAKINLFTKIRPRVTSSSRHSANLASSYRELEEVNEVKDAVDFRIARTFMIDEESLDPTVFDWPASPIAMFLTILACVASAILEQIFLRKENSSESS